MEEGFVLRGIDKAFVGVRNAQVFAQELYQWRIEPTNYILNTTVC